MIKPGNPDPERDRTKEIRKKRKGKREKRKRCVRSRL
jgi:hypothetical protein